MAWDEWEQLKVRAAGRQPTAARLHGLPADASGLGREGARDLVVRQDDLGAVGHKANTLYHEVKCQADIAVEADGNATGSSSQAVVNLKSHGFRTGGALETALEMWTSQVKSVLQACAHISDHLEYTAKLHSEDDARIGSVLRSHDGPSVSVSKLNQYFK
ncbi:hypothetical protein LK08_29660 [Streptomyces sp. MUSC 125]|uniref:hypothetical protein n=1 Tax=Streptomyces sp. MUSC 125 TaxID=1428624 RepID=UPI00057F3B87|nr:hypothetical protein [Streptomyces sp. MUSC 125]KIE23492.1 hypothetical protein LK08_29660 [Streptomyces sp. MUSC 125]